MTYDIRWIKARELESKGMWIEAAKVWKECGNYIDAHACIRIACFVKQEDGSRYLESINQCEREPIKKTNIFKRIWSRVNEIVEFLSKMKVG